MAVHQVRKGLNLPISGAPVQEISRAQAVQHVAVLGTDYVGMKPRLEVDVGDSVKRGQLLFTDRKSAGVRHTSPAAGTIVAINRGDRRAFLSVVIALNERELARETAPEDYTSFGSYTGAEPASLSRDAVRDLLVESGMWTSFRARPFGRVPATDTVPHSIFVTAINTDPLAPDVALALQGQEEAFQAGLHAIAKLTEGPTYVCTAPDSKIDTGDAPVRVEQFAGPHPAGLVGTHIHMLDPVDRNKTVWHLQAQDVLLIGLLFQTGKLWVGRLISVAGPAVEEPRLVLTRTGACLAELLDGGLTDGEVRVVSGSVLSGQLAMGEETGFLGRYSRQVTGLLEGRERYFLGWLSPGIAKFSIVPTYLSKLFGLKRTFPLNTSTNGSHRAMVPIGSYERVFPLDILPTFLLRALSVGDLERAEALGVLELEEEDLALCTVVCPGKEDWGVALRRNLTTIELEG